MVSSFGNMSHVRCECSVFLTGVLQCEPGGKVWAEGFYLSITARYAVAETLTMTRTSLPYKQQGGENPHLETVKRKARDPKKAQSETVRKSQGSCCSGGHRCGECVGRTMSSDPGRAVHVPEIAVETHSEKGFSLPHTSQQDSQSQSIWPHRISRICMPSYVS